MGDEKNEELAEINENYDAVWKEIVENDDGSINMDHLKRELYDFSCLISNVSKVYDHVTNSKASNPMTDPDVIIALSDDEVMALVNEESAKK